MNIAIVGRSRSVVLKMIHNLRRDKECVRTGPGFKWVKHSDGTEFVAIFDEEEAKSYRFDQIVVATTFDNLPPMMQIAALKEIRKELLGCVVSRLTDAIPLEFQIMFYDPFDDRACAKSVWLDMDHLI